MNRSWTTLISAADLRALLADGATPVIVDCGFDLADTEAGERAWREGHLAGSHYMHLDRDLSGPKTGRNGRHPLPERSVFAATLGRLGVDAGDPGDRAGSPGRSVRRAAVVDAALDGPRRGGRARRRAGRPGSRPAAASTRPSRRQRAAAPYPTARRWPPSTPTR